MAQLSRIKKNKDLREKIDLETVISSPADVLNASSSNTTSSHEKKNLQPYKQVQATPNHAPLTSSPVIDELLMEVKKYNMGNGDRVSSDTQMNVLKSLDDEENGVKRRSHLLPMEEEEKLGSTMKLPRTSLESLQQTTDILRFTRPSKINRVAPIVEDEARNSEKGQILGDTEEISSVLVKPTRIEFTEPMMVDPADFAKENQFLEELPEENIIEEAEDDQLDILEFVLDRSNEVPVKINENVKTEKPAKAKKSFFKKKKKNKKEEVISSSEVEEKTKEVQTVDSTMAVPEANPIETLVEAPIQEDPIQEKAEEKQEPEVKIVPVKVEDEYTDDELLDEAPKGSKILNIILIILLVALIGCAGFVLYTILNS